MAMEKMKMRETFFIVDSLLVSVLTGLIDRMMAGKYTLLWRQAVILITTGSAKPNSTSALLFDERAP
jgi:hypothetical protein